MHVQIVMQTVQQKVQKLMCILLGIINKVLKSFGKNFLKNLRVNLSVTLLTIERPKSFYNVSICACNFPTRPDIIVFRKVQILDVLILKEKLWKFICIAQTLQGWIHKTEKLAICESHQPIGWRMFDRIFFKVKFYEHFVLKLSIICCVIVNVVILKCNEFKRLLALRLKHFSFSNDFKVFFRVLLF